MMVKITTILAISFAVYSCATMNANECAVADWQGRGYEDGSRGYSADRYGRHQKACAKHGVKANFTEYKAGYDQGIQTYCTSDLGYAYGKVNRAFPKVCTGNTAATVRRGYNVGREIYLEKRELRKQKTPLNAQINDIDNEISFLLDERLEHEKYLQMANDGLNDPKTNNVQRLFFYTQGAQMRTLIRDKDNEMEFLESTKEPYQSQIDEIDYQIQLLDDRPAPSFR